MIGITLVRGLPGSGKSTYAKTLGIRHLEADMFHVQNATGVYLFNPALVPASHLWCREETEATIKAGLPVVVSNTFTRVHEMRMYFNIAKIYGVPVTVVQMNGDYGSTHNVPQHVLDDMRNRWEYFPEGTLFQPLGRW